MRFSRKIAFSLMGLVIISVGLVSFLFYYSTSSMLRAELEQRATGEAGFVRGGLERFMFERLQDSKSIASSLPFKEYPLDLHKITKRLIDYRNDARVYSSISFYDLNGMRLADTSGLFIGEDVSDRTFFKEALEKGVSSGSEATFSAIYNEPFFYFSSIVKGGNNEPIGVVVSRIPLYRLRDAVNGSGDFGIDIVDRNGRVLFSTRKNVFPLKDVLSDEKVLSHLALGERTGFLGKHFHKGLGSHYSAFAVEDGYLDYRGNGWVVLLWIPEDYISAPLQKMGLNAVFFFLLSVILASIIAIYLNRQVAGPLTKLFKAARDVRDGNLDIVVKYPNKDEFGDLSEGFNKMAVSLKELRDGLEEKVRTRTESLERALKDQLDIREAMLSILEDVNQAKDVLERTQGQLVQAGKLAGIGQMAAGIAHEINNPLTSILGFAQLVLASGVVDDKTKDDLQIIEREAKRCVGIIEGLLNFARPLASNKTKISNINAIVDATVQMIKYTVEREGVEVILDYEKEPGAVEADAQQLQQVFLNLILNAVNAMPGGGSLTVKTEVTMDDGGRTKDETASSAGRPSEAIVPRPSSFLLVSFTDTGRGIPDDIKDKIFEPFFTTSYTVGKKGTGLGLSICYSIIKEHNGTIEFESKVGGGTTFRVLLPVVAG